VVEWCGRYAGGGGDALADFLEEAHGGADFPEGTAQSDLLAAADGCGALDGTAIQEDQGASDGLDSQGGTDVGQREVVGAHVGVVGGEVAVDGPAEGEGDVGHDQSFAGVGPGDAAEEKGIHGELVLGFGERGRKFGQWGRRGAMARHMCVWRNRYLAVPDAACPRSATPLSLRYAAASTTSDLV
jgi:hypothetical protein